MKGNDVLAIIHRTGIKMQNSRNKYYDINIAMDNFICLDKALWFYDYKMNAICKATFETTEVKLVQSLSSFGIDPKRNKIYGKIIENNQKIYVMPEANVPIAIYDLKDESLLYLDYEIDTKRIAGKLFSSILAYDCFVYLIPYAYDHIIKINTNDNDISYIQIDNYPISGEYPRISWDCIAEKQSYVLLPNLQSKSIMKFDLRNDELETLFLSENCAPAAICDGNEFLYVVDMDSKSIYKYSSNDFGLIKTIPLELNGYENGSNSRIINDPDKIFLLGRVANMCLAFDKKTDRVFSMDTQIDGGIRSFPKGFYYSNVMRYMNHYYLFINGREKVSAYNDDMVIVEEKIFRIAREELIKQMKAQKERIIDEYETKGLEVFLEALVDGNV